MVILKSLLYEKFPELIFGFSTKVDAEDNSPFYFNLSMSVGDDEKRVKKNRTEFYSALGLNDKSVAFVKQVHSDICAYAVKGGLCAEGDAMITDQRNLGLAVSVADCTPVFIYDRKQGVIAAIHSGWRGTEKKIVLRTLEKMYSDYNSSPEDLFAYIGPSISQGNYEVGPEVAELFDPRYTIPKGDKFLLNVKGANYDMLKESGIPVSNIQLSVLCTFAGKELFHSYRRDGARSGRHLGVIALR